MKEKFLEYWNSLNFINMLAHIFVVISILVSSVLSSALFLAWSVFIGLISIVVVVVTASSYKSNR